jgi:hypothetical protein
MHFHDIVAMLLCCYAAMLPLHILRFPCEPISTAVLFGRRQIFNLTQCECHNTIMLATTVSLSFSSILSSCTSHSTPQAYSLCRSNTAVEPPRDTLPFICQSLVHGFEILNFVIAPFLQTIFFFAFPASPSPGGVRMVQNGVFCDVKSCGSCKNRRFGGT